MSDPVLRVLASRQSLIDAGYPRSLLLSGAIHTTTVFAVLIVALLTPNAKLINVIDGFAVPLPRGGGMPRAAETARVPEDAAPPPATEAPKAAVPATAPPKFIKPDTAVAKKGVAPVELKRSVKEPKKPESRAVATQPSVATNQTPRAAVAPTPGSASHATGLDFAADTPGVADGVAGPTGALGFYLAAAKGKIWANWMRQIRPDFTGSVTVTFTIHRDGSIDTVEIIESSGSSALDRLAERAILSTPLAPIPSSHDKETIVIHATFKPTS